MKYVYAEVCCECWNVVAVYDDTDFKTAGDTGADCDHLTHDKFHCYGCKEKTHRHCISIPDGCLLVFDDEVQR